MGGGTRKVFGGLEQERGRKKREEDGVKVERSGKREENIRE